MQPRDTPQDAPPPGRPARRRGRGPAVAPRTILVAEDDADMSLLMKTVLELRGYRVVLAGDGQTAVESAREERPDLILVDLQLP